MRREDVEIGALVRLVANYLDVPCGTLATVETVGLLSSTTWGFTVRWHNVKTTPQRKHRYPCSLNLWESDLELFGVATQEKEALLLKTKGPPTLAATQQPRQQLRLPFGDL